MSIIMKKANRVAPARVDAHERTGPISLADITLQADERKASCLVDRPDSLAPKQARDALSGTRVEGCVIALLDLVFRVGAVRHDAADVTESGACPG